jgi:hypothetical protein
MYSASMIHKEPVAVSAERMTLSLLSRGKCSDDCAIILKVKMRSGGELR